MSDKQPTSEHWCVAYRRIGDEAFSIVRNPDWAWSADPFLVEYRGEMYLFAELFLFRSERCGVIGYCRWDGNGFSGWTISMDKHWHLSYPNVFVHDNMLYMIPESYQREDISLYVLDEFPDKWKRVGTIVDNTLSVDTTLVKIKDELYMYTFEPSFVQDGGSLFLYRIKGELQQNNIICEKIDKISEKKDCSRPAGNLFVSDEGALIRPAQNCQNGYGNGISFMAVDSFVPVYKEHIVSRLGANDVKINNRPDDVEYIGLHTYNRLNGFEVIDLKYVVFDPAEQEARERIRKVFVDKYV